MQVSLHQHAGVAASACWCRCISMLVSLHQHAGVAASACRCRCISMQVSLHQHAGVAASACWCRCISMLVSLHQHADKEEMSFKKIPMSKRRPRHNIPLGHSTNFTRTKDEAQRPHRLGNCKLQRPEARHPHAAATNHSFKSSTFTTLAMMVIILMSLDSVIGQSSTKEGSLRPSCGGTLRWVPLLTKRPFTSLLNNAFCPSWMTRHLITKQTQTTHLTLPLKVPVALFCGLCTHPTSTDANLTITHEIGGVLQTVAQTSILTSTGEQKHTERKHECRVQFAVTGPITGSYGSLECSVHYGIRHYTETATYTAYDVPIETKREELDVPGNTAMLTCPAHPDKPTENNPLVHVWYYPLATGPRVAAPTTNPTVTFRLASQEELVVSCATYHLIRLSTVVVTTFRVRKSQTYKLQGDPILNTVDRSRAWDTKKSYGAYGNSEEIEDIEFSTASSAAINLPMVVVAIVSAVGAVLAVFFVIALVKCLRRNNNPRRYR
ncbi:hypothetical protein FHG87_005819 [Trinorchestia longiramus]|nr:hypothetical protein FHG87_005819 [Trinorchestia longiramus]